MFVTPTELEMEQKLVDELSHSSLSWNSILKGIKLLVITQR